MDISELPLLSAQISELGLKLVDLRNQRTALDEEIRTVEKELAPVLVRHGKLIAELAGAALPAPPRPTPTAPQPPNGGQNGPGEAPGPAKQRVLDYLSRAPEAAMVSAMEIAETLRIDPALVREVLRELREGRFPQP